MTMPLTLDDYTKAARRTDQRADDRRGLEFPLLGLFGEAGSLLSAIKKKQRDPIAYLGYEDVVREEIGDMLWYLCAVASHGGLRFDDLAVNLDSSLEDWSSARAGSLTFAELDRPSTGGQTGPSAAFERTSFALAAEVGLLMSDHRAGRLLENRATFEGRLVGVLRALRRAAWEAGLSLEQAARANLDKIDDRWPQERVHPPLFDNDFPTSEQIPRRMTIVFEEIEADGRHFGRMLLNGEPVGDPLTDNRIEDDDYRFHDVFHLAHAAHLGWSPTLRSLLGRKRKSDPRIDEAEDGARAILIEEGIATWIFNHAERLALFEGLKSLDYGLLKSARAFVEGYEAERCPLWLWESAILEGYEVFRAVQRHRGGQVDVDLDRRSIQFLGR